MAVSVHVGSFVRSASTGSQAVTGVGFVPKAIMFWTTNLVATGFDDEYVFLSGITDGTTSVAFCGVSSDNLATTDVRRSHEEGAVLRRVGPTGTVFARAAFTSFDADGFTLNWTVNDGTASIINYWAIGGSSVSADVGSFLSPGAAGAQTISGVGFRPDTIVFLHCWAGATSSSEEFLNMPAIGFADSDRNGGSIAVATEDGVADSNTRRHMTSSHPVMILRSNIGAGFGEVYHEANVATYGSDGFTLDYVTVNFLGILGQVNVYYLALKGVTTSFGTITQPATTGTQTVSLDGRPYLVLFQSIGAPEDASSPISPQDHSQACFGASDGSNQRSACVGDTDALATTVTVRGLANDAVIQCITPNATGASTVVDAEAAVSAFDLEGFVLNWTAADATARTVQYLAFLAAPDDPSELGPFVDGEVSIPLTWLQVTLKDATTRAYAEVDLNDHEDYYHGYKRPWVLEFLPISRGLSDYQGQGEQLSFGARMSDTERYFRGLMEDATNKHLVGRPLAEWMIGDEERRAEELARLIAVGFIDEYAFLSPLQFEIRGGGWIERRFSRRRRGLQAWQPLIYEADFGDNTDIPGENLEIPVPIYYGHCRQIQGKNRGVCGAIYTGIRDVGGTDYHEFVVMRLCASAIYEVYVDNTALSAGEITSDWLIPGDAAWTSAFGADTFRDFNDRRYTVIYGQSGATDPDAVADGTSVLSINLDGVEDVGDGTGDLIESMPMQFLHFLNNFIAPAADTDTIPYLTAEDTLFEQFGSPGLPYVDEASFTTAETDLGARIGSPSTYHGAGSPYDIGETLSVYDALARFCQSLDSGWYYNRRGQVAISVEPIAEVAGVEALDDVLSIVEDSFGVEDLVQTEFFNHVQYVFNRDYTARARDGWWQHHTIVNQLSIDAYDLARTSPRFEFWFLRGNTTTDELGATQDDPPRRLWARFFHPLRRVTLETSLGGLQYEIGDVIPLTHLEGPGAEGWVGRKVRVIRHEVHPSVGRVRLECYDIEPIWEANESISP